MLGGRAIAGAAALILGSTLPLAGCQDAYPVAATRCDRWCDLVQDTFCGNYNPARCVVLCEQKVGGARCNPQFDQLLSCLEQQPNITCFDSGDGLVPACVAEDEALAGCMVTTAPPAPSSTE